MTRNANEKRAVRERMIRTGENYTTALRLHREARAVCPCGCPVADPNGPGVCGCADPCACFPNCAYCDADPDDE